MSAEGHKTVVPTWLSNNIAVICFGIVAAASMMLLDSRHVTASELQVSQSAILTELSNISRKMDLARIQGRIRAINSELEELQLYIDEAPSSPLTNARKQLIRKLENTKEESGSELRILLSKNS